MVSYLVFALIALFVAAYFVGRSRAIASVGGEVAKLHSLPGQHGMFLALVQPSRPALLAARRLGHRYAGHRILDRQEPLCR